MGTVPVVAIVGRPNVGKSTLFNAFTRSRDALVVDLPGVTRDRIYGRCEIAGRTVILIDTGGLSDATGRLESLARRQTEAAIEEADLVLFVSDGRSGPLAEDHEIVSRLRQQGKSIVHVVNKTDGLDEQAALAEASELGLSPVVAIAASHRRGIDSLAAETAPLLPALADDTQDSAEGLKLAFIGRPNVGKSTLLNRFVGEERAVASEVPGTTRDPVHARVERDGEVFQLVDTAGIRRRRATHEAVEAFSVIKALKAMESAEVVVLLLDATEGVTDQDARLAGHVIEAGRALVIVLNKWDGLDDASRRRCLIEVGERMNFAAFAPVVTLSALHGSGLGELIDAVCHVHRSASMELPTPQLTRALRHAVESHPPPSSRRFTPKLRYAHSGGTFPTRIIIHGNRTGHVDASYRRYLINSFRRQFELAGVPLKLIFKDTENPYAGRRQRSPAGGRRGRTVRRKR